MRLLEDMLTMVKLVKLEAFQIGLTDCGQFTGSIPPPLPNWSRYAFGVVA